MQGTTRRRIAQPWRLRLHALAVFSLLGPAVLGQVPGEIGGWPLRPLAVGHLRQVQGRCWRGPLGAMVRYLAQSWRPVLVRSLVLWRLWAWSEPSAPGPTC